MICPNCKFEISGVTQACDYCSLCSGGTRVSTASEHEEIAGPALLRGLANGHPLDLTKIRLSVTAGHRPLTAEMHRIRSFLRRSAPSTGSGQANGQRSGCRKVMLVAKLKPLSQSHSLNALDFRERLRSYGVTHIYIGARGGPLDPTDLLKRPFVELIYNDGPVYIFKLGPD